MDFKYREILTGKGPIDKYPLHLFKRVDEPTNKYVGGGLRRAESDAGYPLEKLPEELRPRAGAFMMTEPLTATFATFQHHIAQYALPEVAEKKAPIPEDPHILARHIKSLAYFAGADMVGICKLPQSTLFTSNRRGEPVECDLKYAIVLLNVKDTKTLRGSYGREWIDDPESFGVYQRCASQGMIITEYIRRLGWPAVPDVAGTYITQMPRLVIDAGLGEVSRLGIALNPFVGAEFKVGAVITDLPLEVDKPIDFGLSDYCRNCKICAEQCPQHAISFKDEKEIYNGYETWKLNHQACQLGTISNTIGNACQRCTKICPWNRRDNQPEDFKNWDGDIKFLHDSVDRQRALIISNNYREPEEYTNKWWFPLHYSEYTKGDVIEAPEFDYDKFDQWLEQKNTTRKEGEK
jgi:ferredoxin